MRELKRHFCSPSEHSKSGAPCSLILSRTFGSRCWGAGSGGEETHGLVGSVRSVRSQNHGALRNKKKKKKIKKKPDMVALLANQSAALLKLHLNWKRRL